MARTVTTTFALRDNYSPAMKRASKITTAFQKDVQKAAKAVDLANKKRLAIRATTSPAIKAINDVKKHLSGIRNAVVHIKARTENFKRDMAPVTNSVKNISRKAWNVTIKLKDKVSAGLRSIARLVKNAAKAATVAIGVGGAAGAYVLGKGMTLEKYQMSIGHFVGVNNPGMSKTAVQAKSDKYMAWLSQNAKDTPFSTGDVIAAGSRAVGVTGGNTDAAQGFVRVAEDMAALTPGKTVMDAMEALADAQMGEMERMKEFNFKLTQEALTEAGGDLFKTKNANGMTIMDMFGGGSSKQAKSGAGKWSTVMGNLEDGLANAGLSLLTALQPLLDLMVTNSDSIGAWFKDVGATIGTFITTTLSNPEFVPKMTKIWEEAKAFLDSITEWVNGKSQRLTPFKNLLMVEGAKLMLGGESKLQGIVDAFNNLINSFIDGLNYIATNWGTIGPAISGLITMLPQLALAFAGFKLLSFGMTTGKALGGLFGGLGGLFGKLFGNKDKGTQTGSVPGGTPNKTTNGQKTPPGPNDKNPPPGGNGEDQKVGVIALIYAWLERTVPKFIPTATALAPGMPVIADWFSQNQDMIRGYPKQVLDNIDAFFKANFPSTPDTGKSPMVTPSPAASVAGPAVTAPPKSAVFPPVAAPIPTPKPDTKTSVTGASADALARYQQQMADRLAQSYYYNPDTGTSTGLKSPKSMFPAEGYNPITLPAPVLTPMNPNTQLIPDNVFAASLIKVSAFVANLGSQVGAGLQSWVKTLLSGGSVTGTVNIKQYLIGGSPIIAPGPGGGVMMPEKYAAGLLHVPYDNYPALLHQGEAVLPASAASAYREGKTGNQAPQINLTVNVDGTGRDVKALADEIMRAAVRKFSEAAFNMA